MVDKVIKSDAEWQQILTPEQHRIAQKNGTRLQRRYVHVKESGRFSVCCGADLFSTEHKFESEPAGPALSAPVQGKHH